MKINILHLLEGAKEARGLTVIIDVFRAFTTEAYFFANGAERVVPVGDEREAFHLKEKYKDALLCGERAGVKLKGFDFGNSPSEIEEIDFTGKTVIHRTSAGTQGIIYAKHADEIIGGSLVTARATAEYIIKKAPSEVSLVAMGLDAREKTDEDILAALYIKSILENAALKDVEKRAHDLQYTSGAKFFDKDKSDVFPTRDFELSTQVDKFPFVIRLNRSESAFGKNGAMERIFP